LATNPLRQTTSGLASILDAWHPCLRNCTLHRLSPCIGIWFFGPNGLNGGGGGGVGNLGSMDELISGKDGCLSQKYIKSPPQVNPAELEVVTTAPSLMDKNCFKSRRQELLFLFVNLPIDLPLPSGSGKSRRSSKLPLGASPSLFLHTSGTTVFLRHKKSPRPHQSRTAPFDSLNVIRTPLQCYAGTNRRCFFPQTFVECLAPSGNIR